MSKSKLLSDHFSTIIALGVDIESKKYLEKGAKVGDGMRIDSKNFLNWKFRAHHLVSMACGPDSEHYRQFLETEKPRMYRSQLSELGLLMAVLTAAKEDYDGGYLNKIRAIIEAEVFSDELDMARELLDAGYMTPAAVVAGIVLETTIRRMCTDRGIIPGKLNTMNAELTKVGAYNLLTQKKVTALADIRNNAAHGHADQYTPADVSDMIKAVESFVSDHV